MGIEEQPAKRNRTRANGEGGAWKDEKRGRWVGSVTVGYDDNGKQARKAVTGKTKKIVVDRMRELQVAVDAGMDPAPRDQTVRKFLEQWTNDLLPGTVAASTEQQYRDVVRLYIIPAIGQKRLRTLKAMDVTVMLRKMEEAGRSRNTQRLARAILRRALRTAEREGMVARNVAALADGVKVGRPDNRHKALTVDQSRQLLDHVKGNGADLKADRLEAAFVLAISLGLRLGEVLGLAWGDLDLDGTPPRATIERGLLRLKKVGLVLSDTKTAGSTRTIQLPAPVVDALRRHRLAQLEERVKLGPNWPALPLGADLVFRSPLGTAVDPDNLRKLCYKLTEAAGIGRRSPHQLRHSAASLLIAQGVPMKLVSELLGHSSIKVTADVYGHLYDEAGAVAADAMAGVLWGEA